MSNDKIMVNNNLKSIWDLTYDELVILYQEFIDKHGYVPKTKECKLSNNLPHSRVINKILTDNDITYNSFVAQFGKYSHVRTESTEFYDKYIDRFVKVCKEMGRTLTSADLINNQYGLPSAKWLIDNCPDKTVTSYVEFVNWCGLIESKHIWTKDEVKDILIEYEKKVDRPLVKNDIKYSTTGFSIIVINRLFGSFRKAKQEIGLLETLPSQPKPFEYYKNALTTVINNYKDVTGLTYITWKDIEKGDYGYKIGHKSYVNAFKRQGLDIHAYILSLGCMMNKQKYSRAFTFPDGERASSNYEKDVTMYLRHLGLQYNIDYFRSVKYKTFSNEPSKMDCDYVITTNNGNLYIEVAGLIYNSNNKWRTHIYNNPIQTEYKEKMLNKERVFINNQLNYLFIFPKDIMTGDFKIMINHAIAQLSQKVS